MAADGRGSPRLRHHFHAFSRLKVPRLVFITGACRTGKTTLGLLLGSMRSVEFIEEPWTALALPVMQKAGLIGPPAAATMLQAFIEESFNDRILLRNANFRRSDWSSIWRFKSRGEIARRLNGLKSRSDVVRHVEKNRSVLVISVTQTDPCLDFLKAALPQALIIHMVRQALPAVLDRDWVRRSALLTDAQMKKPWENDLHYDFKPGPRRPTLAIPWWVPRGRTREFLALPVLGRRLFYWLMMHRGGLEASERLPRARAGDYWRLDYESFAMDPLAAASRFGRLLGASPTARTRQLAREILARPRGQLAPADWSGVPSSLLRQASRLQERLGYPPLAAELLG